MKKLISLFVLLIILLTIVGCRSSGENTFTFEKPEKTPNGIVDFRDSLNEIFFYLSFIEKFDNMTEEEIELENYSKEEIFPSEESRIEDFTNKGGVDDNGNNNEVGGLEEEGNQARGNTEIQPIEGPSKEPETKDEYIKTLWLKIDKLNIDLNQLWNQFEGKFFDTINNNDISKELKNQLNLLTINIEKEDVREVTKSGGQVLLKLAPLYDNYKEEIKGDICRLVEKSLNGYVLALNDEIEEANQAFNGVEELASKIKSKAVDEDEDMIPTLDKLRFAILDLKETVDLQNPKVLKIKKDIIINHMLFLEK